MKNKGFSLVELIVVIAIMAILVGVAVPVYTSYIEKANAAKDEQLLGEINSAFNVVCAGTALDINTVTDATIDVAEDGSIDLSTMVVKVGSTEVEGFAAKMVEILGTDLKFNVIEEIWYDATAHKFVDDTAAPYKYGDTTIYLSPSDIAALKASNYATLGMKDLLSKVNAAVDVVVGVDSSSSLYDLVYGDDAQTMNTIAEMLGFDSAEDVEFGEAYFNLIVEKAALLASVDNYSLYGGSADAAKADEPSYSLYYDQAEKQVQANAAVLTAATSKNIDTATMKQNLANGTAISEIKNASTEDQLGQVALAYAMYTSYVTEYNKTADAANKKEVSTDVGAVLLTIKSDEGFKAYMNTEQATIDMNGYMAAMNMINDSTKDPEAVQQLIVNGFTDKELENTLTGAIG